MQLVSVIDNLLEGYNSSLCTKLRAKDKSFQSNEHKLSESNNVSSTWCFTLYEALIRCSRYKKEMGESPVVMIFG